MTPQIRTDLFAAVAWRLLVVVAVVALAACDITVSLPAPQPAQLGDACGSPSNCNVGLVCVADRCERSCDDSSDCPNGECAERGAHRICVVDAEPDPPDSGPAPVPDAGPGPGPDAGPDSGTPTEPDDAGTTPPTPTLDNGEPCDRGTQCKSGHCPADDGVCCDAPCDGVCQSCRGALTDFADGQCAPVPLQEDPEDECPGEAPSTCGRAGLGCNGQIANPGCLLHHVRTQCAAPICEQGVETAARFCDGMGTCSPVPPTDCGVPCNAAGTACADPTCEDGVQNGAEAGVDCGGACAACPSCEDGLQNGDETGVDCGGTCDACPTCDDGLQNGEETGVDCGGPCEVCPSCDDGLQNGEETGVDCGGACDVCPTCEDGLQNGNETGVDCGGTCQACLGEACLSDDQCVSGHCPPQDGVCCEVTCLEDCMACAGSKTGQGDGVCAPVEVGTDPDGECLAQDPSSCGFSGAGCDGAAVSPACLLYASGVECAPPSCENGVESTARECDGAGVCGAAVETACGPYACAADALQCRGECTLDEHCALGFGCSMDSECVEQLRQIGVDWIKEFPNTGTEAQMSLGPVFAYSDPSIYADSGTLFALTATGEETQVLDYVFFGGSQTVIMPCPDPGPDLLCDNMTLNRVQGGVMEVHLSANRNAVMAFTMASQNATQSWLAAAINDPPPPPGYEWFQTMTDDFGDEPSHGRWTAIMEDNTALFRVDTGVDPVGFGEGPLYTGNLLARVHPFDGVLWVRTDYDGPQLYSDSTGGLVSITEAERASQLGCPAETGQGMYLARLDADVQCLWGRDYQGVAESAVVAADMDGFTYIAAAMRDTADYGTGAGPVAPLRPDADDLVVMGVGDDGATRWVHRLSGAGLDAEVNVSAAERGLVLVYGLFSGSLEVGGLTLDPADGDHYLLVYSSAGQLVGVHQVQGAFRAAVAPDHTLRLVSHAADFDPGNGSPWTTNPQGVAVVSLELDP